MTLETQRPQSSDLNLIRMLWSDTKRDIHTSCRKNVAEKKQICEEFLLDAVQVVTAI